MSVRWLDEKQSVVYHRLEGKWTWFEFYKAHDEVMRLMKSVDHPVSLLTEFFDWSSGVIPSGLFLHAQRLLKQFPANHHKIIIISKNPFTHIAVVGAKQVLKTKIVKTIQIVPSIDDAHKLLDVAMIASV